jgi:hypothetical protein
LPWLTHRFLLPTRKLSANLVRGFTPYLRDDFLEWKREGRLVNDGVNAKASGSTPTTAKSWSFYLSFVGLTWLACTMTHHDIHCLLPHCAAAWQPWPSRLSRTWPDFRGAGTSVADACACIAAYIMGGGEAYTLCAMQSFHGFLCHIGLTM